MVPVVRAGQLGCLLLVLAPGELRAEPSPGRTTGLGDTAWALPGIVRVGVPGAAPRRVAVAASAGYGMTEAQAPTTPASPPDAAHNRFFGSAAVGLAPLPALELSLRFDGRYDQHPDDGRGAHGAAVGDPRLLARYGARAGDAFRVGFEAAAWFPGKDAPSLALNATTVDARALGAWAPDGGPTVAIAAGFRLDQSANAAPARNLIRPGDRLAIGLSDFNAVLVGAGVAVPAGRSEILGELSADLLMGSGAPGLGQSPIRITAGVRHHLSDALGIGGLIEVSPSSRPGLGPTDPLVPVEPRFSLLLALTYRLPFDAVSNGGAPPEEKAPAKTPTAVAAPAATTATLTLRVVGEDGAPAKDATVTVTVAGGSEAPRPAAGTGDGTYRLESVPFGPTKIDVAAEGFAATEQSIDVAADTGKAPVEIRMKALAPSGQIRGLIRSFDGKGLPATIHVDPLGSEVKADAQGAFTIDVPPGDYEVTIKASRFKEQHRKVHVDKNGVTVINAELFEGK